MLSSQRLWPMSWSFWVAFMVFLLAGSQPFLALDGLIGSPNVTDKKHVKRFNPGRFRLPQCSVLRGLVRPGHLPKTDREPVPAVDGRNRQRQVRRFLVAEVWPSR